MPTAWLQNSGTNWPGLRGHSQLRRCRTPRALPSGAYPLASPVLHCPPLDVHCANFMVLPAPAVGTKRRKQCVSTPPLIKIRAEYQCEHVLHRFVKSQLNITPGIPKNRPPGEAQRQRVRRGEEEQRSDCAFRPQGGNKGCGACDDEGPLAALSPFSVGTEKGPPEGVGIQRQSE